MEPTAPPPRPAGAASAAAGATRPRGWRKWFIAGAVVLALAMLFGSRGGGGKPRDVTVTFVGFTNVDGKTRAFFWVTNGAHHALGHFECASLREGGEWVPAGNGSSRVHQVAQDSTAGESRHYLEETVLMSLEMGEARLPLRTEVGAREPPAGLNKVKAKLRQQWWKLRGGGGILTDGSRYYAVTNEFQPER